MQILNSTKKDLNDRPVIQALSSMGFVYYFAFDERLKLLIRYSDDESSNWDCRSLQDGVEIVKSL